MKRERDFYSEVGSHKVPKNLYTPNWFRNPSIDTAEALRAYEHTLKSGVKYAKRSSLLKSLTKEQLKTFQEILSSVNVTDPSKKELSAKCHPFSHLFVKKLFCDFLDRYHETHRFNQFITIITDDRFYLEQMDLVLAKVREIKKGLTSLSKTRDFQFFGSVELKVINELELPQSGVGKNQYRKFYSIHVHILANTNLSQSDLPFIAANLKFTDKTSEFSKSVLTKRSQFSRRYHKPVVNKSVPMEDARRVANYMCKADTAFARRIVVDNKYKTLGTKIPVIYKLYEKIQFYSHNVKTSDFLVFSDDFLLTHDYGLISRVDHANEMQKLIEQRIHENFLAKNKAEHDRRIEESVRIFIENRKLEEQAKLEKAEAQRLLEIKEAQEQEEARKREIQNQFQAKLESARLLVLTKKEVQRRFYTHCNKVPSTSANIFLLSKESRKRVTNANQNSASTKLCLKAIHASQLDSYVPMTIYDMGMSSRPL